LGFAPELALKEAQIIAAELTEQGVMVKDLEKKEVIALIAYLQALGQKIAPKVTPTEVTK
jgi:cbb3-type cytochrome oxidase cytochrome c subunit